MNSIYLSELNKLSAIIGMQDTFKNDDSSLWIYYGNMFIYPGVIIVIKTHSSLYILKKVKNKIKLILHY